MIRRTLASMAYALTSNPNRHYYTSRRSPILGIVLHVTAGLEDFAPPDRGAEAVVQYGMHNTRPASWHGIADSDSIIDCLPDSYTAFHCIGLNSPSLGLEIANANARWTGKPRDWVDNTIANAAKWCAPRVKKYDLPIRLASAAEVRRAVSAGKKFGFTYHSYMDPTRRIDPGKDFPWSKFEADLRASLKGGIVSPAAASKLYVRGPFPLPKGHWYGPESKNPKNHSGYATRDRQGISQIQAEVGSRVDGRYGTKTRDAVRSWQVAHKVTPADGLVGIDTWNALLLN